MQIEKFRMLPFDWKLTWKYFEKYIKKEIREYPGASQKRESILAFIKRTLNESKIRTMTKDKIKDIENVLKDKCGNNKFFEQSAQLFIRFLNDMLS